MNKELFLKLAESETLNQVSQMSEMLPVDARNPGDVKPALAVAATCVISAIDQGRIGFADAESHAALIALLSIAINVVIDGENGTTGSVH